MTEILYGIAGTYIVALLVWCALVLIWNALAPKLEAMLDRRRANRKKHVLRAENIPGTTGYRIKTR